MENYSRLFKPSFGNEEIKAVIDVMQRSWVGLGPKVNMLEEKWEEYLEVKHRHPSIRSQRHASGR